LICGLFLSEHFSDRKWSFRLDCVFRSKIADCRFQIRSKEKEREKDAVDLVPRVGVAAAVLSSARPPADPIGAASLQKKESLARA
jgi:hypothetical protein